MYGQPGIGRRLPPEAEMDRDDALDAFLAVVNTVRPDHPHHSRSVYPVDRDRVKFGTTRTYYGRCGPRSGHLVAYYATRMSYIRGISRERHLALLIHEVTHIPYGSGYGLGKQHGGHPREFWQEMAFLATELRDAIDDGVLLPVFGDIDVGAFLMNVVDDPNPSTVDRRYWSVEECRDELRSLVGLD